ncbi:hypothetical protein Q4S45_05340 [Massilia sp. R2A-15]|uniref:hypothetical protein n=1 Tax=Massilia sp. R2A-15 TaxID=3064278 RepID=UPI0027344B9F|nr:hypothetical protein [Massilia sp. R2A-15]WLI90547.1 hypothetical protein Q4S45_05340 [Massilia sp. R2A-15]
MVRRILAAALIVLFVAPASAHPGAKPPSEMMADLNKLKAERGSFIVSIHVEAPDKAGAERCLKIFSENGVSHPNPISLSSPTPPTLYQLEGTKEYAEAGDAADKLVALVSASAAPGQVTWTVSKKTMGW